MYYYKARIYSSKLGRFLQTDPIGYADQNNLYAYVGNDPINGRDPAGLCTGSLIGEESGVCRNASLVNPGLNGAGTSDGAVPGQGGKNAGTGSVAEPSIAESADSPQSDDCTANPQNCITVAGIANNSKTSEEILRRCRDACYPILERWQPPGSDRNQWDYHECVKICVADAEEEKKKYQYTHLPSQPKPKPWWHPYPRPWWFWWPPALPPKRTPG